MGRKSDPLYGEIETHVSDEIGKLKPVLDEFLTALIERIAIRSAEYYKKTNGYDHLIFNTEGEFTSVFCPAIADITPIFKKEFPVWRAYSGKKSGNLDYWIFYKNMILALELKYTHKGYFQGDCDASKQIFNRYNGALTQLNKIEDNKHLRYIENAKRLVKIALLTIVFDYATEDERRLNNKLQDALKTDIKSQINKRIKPLLETGVYKKNSSLKLEETPNFKGLWMLDEKLFRIKAGKMPKHSMVLAVGFIGHIEKC